MSIALPEPFYCDDLVTIYNGDAFALLPLLAESTPWRRALVTDPPFGSGWSRNNGGGVGEFIGEHVQPAWDVFSLEYLHLCQPSAFAIFSTLKRAPEVFDAIGGAVVHWRKTNPRPNGPDRDAITISPARLPAGIEFRAYNGDTPLHPCQKPVDLMTWVLGFIDPSFVVVDPFAGSGATLEAAKNLGRRAIGIELNATYCEAAADRCRQLSLSLV